MINRKESVKIAVLIGGIVLVSALGILYRVFMTSQPQSYTVGVVIKIWKPPKGGTKAKYEYTVDGESYRADVSNYDFESVAKPDKRFLVKFPKEYHWAGVMLLNVPIPDSVNAPFSGWENRPAFH